MKERGIVINHDKTGINVQMHQGFDCEGCSACFIDKNKRHILRIHQDIQVENGAQVEVEVHPGFAVKSALVLFLLPLLSLITGYFLFESYLNIPGIPGHYQGIAGSLLAFLVTYFFIYRYDRRLSRADRDGNVRIVRVIRN